MRILHVTEVSSGGTITVISQLSNDQIDRQEVESVKIIAPSDSVSYFGSRLRENLTVYKRTGRNIFSLFRLLLIFRTVILSYKPDVIHLHSTLAGWLCRSYLLMGGKNKFVTVYTPHSWCFEMQVGQAKKKIYAAIERFLASKATTRIICVSNTERSAAIEERFSSDLIRVVVNGVQCDSERDYPQREVAVGNLRVLFVGRMSRQKGVDILWKVIDKVGSHVEFTVVGDTADYRNMTFDEKTVRFLEWQPPSTLKQLYLTHDVLIMPSRWEGLPMVALEAGACGCPILASDIPIFREIVVDGVDGVLAKLDDAESFSVALENIEKRHWHLLGQRSREKIEKNYRLRDTCLRTIAVYKDE